MEYKLEDLEGKYELELDRLINKIENDKVKSVLLQLPDGLKPWGVVMSEYVKAKCECEVMIWLGDCFGACDLPDSGCDLVVQFGHSQWEK